MTFARPAGFFRDKGPKPESARLELLPPPGLEHDAAFVDGLTAALSDAEDRAAASAVRDGSTFAGARRVLAHARQEDAALLHRERLDLLPREAAHLRGQNLPAVFPAKLLRKQAGHYGGHAARSRLVHLERDAGGETCRRDKDAAPFVQGSKVIYTAQHVHPATREFKHVFATRARDVEYRPSEIFGEPVDVRNSEACAAFVEKVADRTGRIDLLVNNDDKVAPRSVTKTARAT